MAWELWGFEHFEEKGKAKAFFCPFEPNKALILKINEGLLGEPRTQDKLTETVVFKLIPKQTI